MSHHRHLAFQVAGAFSPSWRLSLVFYAGRELWKRAPRKQRPLRNNYLIKGEINMRTKLSFVVGAMGLMLAAALPMLAHHSFAAEFDSKTPLKLRGTVTKMEWINPHAWIWIDVKDADGKVTNWGGRVPARPQHAFPARLYKDLDCGRHRDSGGRISRQGRLESRQRPRRDAAGWTQAVLGHLESGRPDRQAVRLSMITPLRRSRSCRCANAGVVHATVRAVLPDQQSPSSSPS